MNNMVEYYDLFDRFHDYIDNWRICPLLQLKNNNEKKNNKSKRSRKKREISLTQISFFTWTYNSFVCIVTLMLRRRREKEQEIISSKGYVILLTCIYTYIYIHTQYTA
jgi:hypothetical protein